MRAYLPPLDENEIRRAPSNAAQTFQRSSRYTSLAAVSQSFRNFQSIDVGFPSRFDSLNASVFPAAAAFM
ncbi:MAG: hypothetical protein LBD58_02730 [Treponema sp.]|nr:hypothetical protein [Treponema sp.]